MEDLLNQRDELAVLYPELRSAGGLVGAIRDSARSRSLDVGTVCPRENDLGQGGFSFRSNVREVIVKLGLERRNFSISLFHSGEYAADGAVSSLDELVQLANCWNRGDRLAELILEFSFVNANSADIARVDGGDAVWEMWEILTTDPEFAAEAPLIKSLRKDVEIRKYMPYASHGGIELKAPGDGLPMIRLDLPQAGDLVVPVVVREKNGAVRRTLHSVEGLEQAVREYIDLYGAGESLD